LTRVESFEPGGCGQLEPGRLPLSNIVLTATSKGNCRWRLLIQRQNFMVLTDNEQAVRAIPEASSLGRRHPEKPWEAGSFSATVSDPGVRVNHAWFRGGWWDPLTMAWKDVVDAACFERPPTSQGTPSPGASLFVPFRLAPGESKTMVLRLAWFVG